VVFWVAVWVAFLLLFWLFWLFLWLLFWLFFWVVWPGRSIRRRDRRCRVMMRASLRNSVSLAWKPVIRVDHCWTSPPIAIASSIWLCVAPIIRAASLWNCTQYLQGIWDATARPMSSLYLPGIAELGLNWTASSCDQNPAT